MNKQSQYIPTSNDFFVPFRRFTHGFPKLNGKLPRLIQWAPLDGTEIAISQSPSDKPVRAFFCIVTKQFLSTYGFEPVTGTVFWNLEDFMAQPHQVDALA